MFFKLFLFTTFNILSLDADCSKAEVSSEKMGSLSDRNLPAVEESEAAEPCDVDYSCDHSETSIHTEMGTL